jgi:2,4-dienoyl-CoA reductase-like NADH-dependent reductase (Old Yellow Enzyme family)
MTEVKSSLFSPIRLRDLVLENRIVVSPMCQYSAVDGTAQPWHWVHIGSLSMSGAALVIMEATAVEARGRITPECLGIYSDENESALRRLLAELRPHSTARFGIQLNHAGRKSSTYKTWDLIRGHHVPRAEGGWEVIGPSATAYSNGWLTPKAMDRADLADVQALFVAAAQRAERCGFDLIELHAAHGYLLHSFVSPLSNQRTDVYGGSLEARMRYPLEVARAVRAAWPAHKPMGVRINGSDWHDAGLTEPDAVIFARALRDVGADYITPSAGSAAPGMQIPPVVPGYMVHFAEHIRAANDVPTMAVGMIVTPQQAEAIVADGRADMVAIARGFLDDPRWGWHAAAALGAEVRRPPQYGRTTPHHWPGYAFAHAGAPELEAGAMGHAVRD